MKSKSRIRFSAATTTMIPLTTMLAVLFPWRNGRAIPKKESTNPTRENRAIAPVAATTPSLNFSVGCSTPSPEAPDVFVQHQGLLKHRHALALAPELGEQLAQSPAPRHVEPERLGEVLLRMRRCVRRDVVPG